jgi:hypothetical protein
VSDVSSGTRSPNEPFAEPAYPETGVYVAPVEPYTAPTSSVDSGSDESKAKQVASQATQTASEAAGEVKETAKEQAQKVVGEAKTQFGAVASDVRDRVGEQARTQNDKLVTGIRQTANQLDEMRGDRQDSPAATVVSRVADGGRELADYLDRHGPDGVLREVQDFARRRPAAFLATALAAGFVVGRLGKSVAKADPDPGTAKPGTDSFESVGSAGGTTSTDYVSTGTGVPVVVEEDQTRGYPGGTK